MTKIKIRSARKNDIDALVEMQVGFEKYFQKLGSCEVYKINKAARRKDIMDLNFSKNHIMRTLVAEIDGVVVGRISFYKGYVAEVPPCYIFRLSGVFVREQYRRMGITKKLFDALIKIAKREKITSISWSVWGPNTSAVKFYDAIGAKYYSKEYDEHYMFLDV
ncbi:MAG: GNAT family N-acetyltransferase [Lactobacillales bacterium]|jgi:ribosomal protein S18 acetylase RimI-like enzyme|nr:GNAT family N-acetyltransferase [Lactobacillales bacterium]